MRTQARLARRSIIALIPIEVQGLPGISPTSNHHAHFMVLPPSDAHELLLEFYHRASF